MGATDLLQEYRRMAGLDPRPGLDEGWMDPKPLTADDMEGGEAKDKFSSNGWARIALVQSDRDPTAFYRLGVRTLKEGGTEIGCDCPGWIRWHKPCKHLKAVFSNASSSKVKLTPFGRAWLPKHKEALKAVGESYLPPRDWNVGEFHRHLLTPEFLAECEKEGP